MMHRLLPQRERRRWKIGVRKHSHRDPVVVRISSALPEDVAAAIRAEVKADLPHVLDVAGVNFALTLKPDLAPQIKRTRVYDGSLGFDGLNVAVQKSSS